MKVTSSTQRKLRIEGANRLDPIDVFIEDVGPRQGKITINCYGKSWTAYWGGMGERTVAEFFLSCDERYLAGCLSSLRAYVPDYSGLNDKARAEVLRLRRSLELDHGTARDLYDRLDHRIESEWEIDRDAMAAVFGDEWWHFIPDAPNPDYEYLCRIILAVQEGLRIDGEAPKVAA